MHGRVIIVMAGICTAGVQCIRQLYLLTNSLYWGRILVIPYLPATAITDNILPIIYSYPSPYPPLQLSLIMLPIYTTTCSQLITVSAQLSSRFVSVLLDCSRVCIWVSSLLISNITILNTWTIYQFGRDGRIADMSSQLRTFNSSYIGDGFVWLMIGPIGFYMRVGMCWMKYPRCLLMIYRGNYTIQALFLVVLLASSIWVIITEPVPSAISNPSNSINPPLLYSTQPLRIRYQHWSPVSLMAQHDNNIISILMELFTISYFIYLLATANECKHLHIVVYIYGVLLEDMVCGCCKRLPIMVIMCLLYYESISLLHKLRNAWLVWRTIVYAHLYTLATTPKPNSITKYTYSLYYPSFPHIFSPIPSSPNTISSISSKYDTMILQKLGHREYKIICNTFMMHWRITVFYLVLVLLVRDTMDALRICMMVGYCWVRIELRDLDQVIELLQYQQMSDIMVRQLSCQ